MRLAPRATVALLALVLCAYPVLVSADHHEAKTHTVVIDASSFTPASLTVKAGDTVEWVNKDLIAHTATSDKDGVFDSDTIEPGKSWKYTATTKGEFGYSCTFHPSMTGTLRVE